MIFVLIAAGYMAIFWIYGMPLIKKKKKREIAIFTIVFVLSLAYTSIYATNHDVWSPYEAVVQQLIKQGFDMNRFY